MSADIIKRIEDLVQLSGLTVRKFAHYSGLNEQSLYKCINGRLPSVDTLQKILTTHPDISAEWLLMGEGEMKKQNVEILKEQIRVKDEQIMELIQKIK